MNGPKNVFDEWNDDVNLPQIKIVPSAVEKESFAAMGTKSL